MKKWNDIADEFSYTKFVPWATMQGAVQGLGGIPFAPPAEQKKEALDDRTSKLKQLKKDNPGKPPEEVVKSAELRSFFQARLREFNKPLSDVEAIAAFTLIAQPFSQDNGEMTPTMKVRRS